MLTNRLLSIIKEYTATVLKLINQTKLQPLKYEIVNSTTIKILPQNNILQLGTSIQDIDKLLTIDADSTHITKFIFDDTKEEFADTSIWYNNMSINIIFRNDKAVLFQFPNDSKLIFHNINLADINYKHTLQSLIQKQLKIRETENNESIIDEFNLILYHPSENELETVCMFTPGHSLSKAQEAKYNVRMFSENGHYVFKYTPKEQKNPSHLGNFGSGRGT